MHEDLSRDHHRPRYHFLPPANWMNDPNGVIQWRGQYHLFYQYNPHGPFHGNIHWGHAVSRDLVHWTHLPIALAPTPGTIDEDGCWSGCAIDDDGTPTFIYSGNGAGGQLACLARGSADLLRWEKYAGNPVIAAPPDGLDLVGFRDHCVWREGDQWYQLIGAGIRDVGGAALLYTSPDLVDWDYLHPLLVGDSSQQVPVWSGTMWECPQLLPVGDKHILLISVLDGDRAYYVLSFTGHYVDHTFLPERQELLDGGCFYAPQALIDEAGRRIMWGWLREARSVEEQGRAGWSGVMSLPRVLSLRSDGLITIQPAPELRQLRGKHRHHMDLELALFAARPLLNDLQGDALEIIATFEPGDAEAFGVLLRCSPDLREETRIVYDSQRQCIAIDRARASLDPFVERKEQSTPCTIAPGERITMHIFLDRSVIEVFVNERACLSSRIYPTLAESLEVGLYARGDNAYLVAFDAWEMGTIW